MARGRLAPHTVHVSTGEADRAGLALPPPPPYPSPLHAPPIPLPGPFSDDYPNLQLIWLIRWLGEELKTAMWGGNALSQGGSNSLLHEGQSGWGVGWPSHTDAGYLYL